MQSEMMDLGFSVGVADELTTRGTYTAEIFSQRHPDKYAMCKQALAMGFALNTIAKALGVAWETVRAVQRSETPDSIRELKKRLAGLALDIVQQRLEQLAQDPEAVRKLSILEIGILTDKGLLLAGEATAINEVRTVDPAVEAFREFMGTVSPAREKVAKGAEVPSLAAASSGLQPLVTERLQPDSVDLIAVSSERIGFDGGGGDALSSAI